MNLDAILALDHGDVQLSGAIADFVLFDNGRIAFRIWPDDPDTPYTIARMTRHNHVFVVSSEPTDVAALWQMVEERYGL